jgi:hypothetical protein
MIRTTYSATVALICLTISSLASSAQSSNPRDFEIHDKDREQPRIVDPGTEQNMPAPIPSDAIVLFDGKNLSEWQGKAGDAGWLVEEGYLLGVPGKGHLKSKKVFGDIQLYVEWASPPDVVGDGQNRGNSGIFIMDRYEVQVLDSFKNTTYPDGQAAAVYGQYPPLVNASRPPGKWQTYNIVFSAPKFDDEGKLLEAARVTVIHNGVLVQNNVELTGPTKHYKRPEYKAHGKGPIRLQDHYTKPRYRRIWVREL